MSFFSWESECYSLHYNKPVRSYLGKPQFPPSQPGCLEFPLRKVEFPGNDARDLLFPGNPVQSHLGAHVVIQRPVGVVLDHLLSAALSLPHRLQWAVPVQQLEDRHHLLELQHCLQNIKHWILKVDTSLFCRFTFPRFCWSMNLYAPMPELGSVSVLIPWIGKIIL